MAELTRPVARRIIETVGGEGIPPEYGFQFFTAGLGPYTSLIEDEYLSTFIKDGGSSFKMVVGVYGGGKTHFMYHTRELAWKHNFVVSYVMLRSDESPFHKLELVYKSIVRSLLAPLSPEELMSGYEKGIVSFLRRYYAERYAEHAASGLVTRDLQEEILGDVDQVAGVESLSFIRGIRSALAALVEQDESEFQNICQWLIGEGYDRKMHRRHGIFQKIDKTTAFTMIRSLGQLVREIGYSGLIVLFDEAERMSSLSARQREHHLSNLRELIDECGQAAFQGMMIFYAVPDETFLEGRSQVYEALKQRVSTVFETLNPSGVKIELEKVVSDPIQFLTDVGNKLCRVYETAYDTRFDDSDLEPMIEMVASDAYEERYADIGYKRLFVQRLIRGCHFLRQKGSGPSRADLG